MVETKIVRCLDFVIVRMYLVIKQYHIFLQTTGVRGASRKSKSYRVEAYQSPDSFLCFRLFGGFAGSKTTAGVYNKRLVPCHAGQSWQGMA